MNKPIVKGINSAPPTKYNNMLIASALALKFNIVLNGSLGKVQGASNFGSLIYNPLPGDLPEVTGGVTVDSIARLVDFYLTCRSTVTDSSKVLAVVDRINGVFSGPFDSAQFGGKTILKPVKPLAEQSVLYRTSLLEAEPITVVDWTRPENVPMSFELMQNYPNPFNPTTTIQFNLLQDALVTLKVYNMVGQEVLTLADHQEFTEGNNEVDLDASNLASGVYFYRLIARGIDEDGHQTNTFQAVTKMVLLK